jgi:electron transport complex protein RnfE
MGLGFTLALVLLGAGRELLGSGSLFGLGVPGLQQALPPVLLLVLPPGAFLALGFLLAAINGCRNRRMPPGKP